MRGIGIERVVRAARVKPALPADDMTEGPLICPHSRHACASCDSRAPASASGHVRPTTLLRILPMPSIETSTTSPGAR